MADNLNVTLPGVADDQAPVATDQYASDGSHAQLVKIDLGADGLKAMLSSANPMPMVAAASDALLTQVRDAIKAQIDLSVTLWTDNSGVYYSRRDLVNEGTGAITIAFTDPTGTAATPGAGLRPLSVVDRDAVQTLFDVITSGTGYTAGDLLAQVRIYDPNAASPLVTLFWINLTTGATISAPNSAHVERADESIGARQVGAWTVGISGTVSTGGLTDTQLRASAVPVSAAALPLPSGASTETTLAAVDTNLGAKADTAATTDTGTFSLIALIKRLFSKLPSALGQTTAANSLAVVLASDQAAVPVTSGNMTTVTGATASAVNTDLLTGTVSGWYDARNFRSVSFTLIGSAGISAGAVTFEHTNDTTLAASGVRMQVHLVGLNYLANTVQSQAVAANSVQMYQAPVLFGYVRARISTAIAGGTVRCLAHFSPDPITSPLISVSPYYDSGGALVGAPVAQVSAGSRLGYVSATAQWYDDSVTTLGTSASFTGTARDALATTAGAQLQGFWAYPVEVRAIAESDVLGTLWIEVSRDGSTNWRRVKSVATAAVTGGGMYAETTYKPTTRYWRAGFDNGVTGQARFMLQSLQLGG